MPLALFRNRSPAACLFMSFAHGLTYISVLYYLPIYFQVVLGATPILSGVWLLITAIPLSVTTVLAALLIRKLGRYRGVIWTSACLLTLGTGLATLFGAHRSWPLLVIIQLLFACGIGPLFQAPLIALQASVPQDQVSRASGTFVFLRTISSAVGLIVGEIVIQHELGQNLARTDLGDISPTLLYQVTKNLSSFQNIVHLSAHQQDIVRTALASALSRVWTVNTTFAGAGLIASLFVRRYKLT